MKTVIRIAALDGDGRGLCVDFRRSADRYAHLVSAVDMAGDVCTPLLESVEGTPHDLWPPSPPLQNLNERDLTRGAQSATRVPTATTPQPAMLLGMAGPNNWSLSVEAGWEHPAGQRGPRLLFDAACRLRSTKSPARLGSQYRLADKVTATVDRHQLVVTTPNGQYALVVLEEEASTATCPICLSLADGIVSIGQRTDDLPAAAPCTLRWRYSIREG